MAFESHGCQMWCPQGPVFGTSKRDLHRLGHRHGCTWGVCEQEHNKPAYCRCCPPCCIYSIHATSLSAYFQEHVAKPLTPEPPGLFALPHSSGSFFTSLSPFSTLCYPLTGGGGWGSFAAGGYHPAAVQQAWPPANWPPGAACVGGTHRMHTLPKHHACEGVYGCFTALGQLRT